MHRTLLLSLALAVVVTVPARPDSPLADVSKAIDTLNKAFEKSDVQAVAALMTEDHVAVTPYYPGPMRREEQLKTLSDHKLSEYKAGKYKIQSLGADSALVTYEVALKGTFKGKPMPARSFASAVWVRRGGKWLEAFYQETPLTGE